MDKIEIERMLIEFAVAVIGYTDQLEKRRENVHLTDQIIRSSTACALNYGEAQSAESRKDVIHKLGIVMKELRETQINLRLMQKLNPGQQEEIVSQLISESDHLLAIFHKTIMTLKNKE